MTAVESGSAAARDLEAIVGQKVVITRAKKSISNFKLREKMPIGCRVTLRRDAMYEFLDRLIATALPRIRDVSVQIAVAVAEEAYGVGLARRPRPAQLEADIRSRMFVPEYRDYV